METNKLFGIASVLFGIVSVGFSMIFFISFPAAVLAITFGIFAVKRFYRKSGTTGIVIGIVGIVLTIIVFVDIVQALDVDSLIAGKWYTEDGEYINFTGRGEYLWCTDSEIEENYTSGYYTLSTGIYKNGKKYTMGYTVNLKQLKKVEGSKESNDEQTFKWLIYTPGKEVLDERSDNYEMMNLTTGQVIKIQKEKKKLFWIF